MQPRIEMKILAKMACDIKSVSQEEAREMVINVMRLKDAHDDLQKGFVEIKKQAEIAKKEIEFLSIE